MSDRLVQASRDERTLAAVRRAREQLEAEGVPVDPETIVAFLAGMVDGRRLRRRPVYLPAPSLAPGGARDARPPGRFRPTRRRWRGAR